MLKQEILNSNTVKSDPILSEVVKTLARNRDALIEVVMNNGLEDEKTYRYAVGKYWALTFALETISQTVEKYQKQEE